MIDPLKELLDTLHEIDDLEVRSKFIIIAARLNRQRVMRRSILTTVGTVMQDLRVSIASMKHDLEATKRERDALSS